MFSLCTISRGVCFGIRQSVVEFKFIFVKVFRVDLCSISSNMFLVNVCMFCLKRMVWGFCMELALL